MAIEHDIDDALEPTLRFFRHRLQQELAGELVDVYVAGSAQMIQWATGAPGLPTITEGPVMKQAIQYAEKHCARMITKMDEETKHRLAKVISDGIQNKRGIPGLRADLRREFADMTKARADTIARTETADALEQAFMDRAKDMGVTGKEWIAELDACDICAANAAEGVVPLDHVFSSGDVRPPAHPNCKCALAPVMR